MLAGLVAAAGCRHADLTDGRYQGMVELEQIDLAFEVGGRVIARPVVAGAAVRAGQVIARLDDAVDREQRAIRVQEVAVARADLAALAAGSRPEDVRAARAQLAAATTTEQMLTRERDRIQTLVAQDAVPAAQLDDALAQLARAHGDRAALGERVRLLDRGTRAEELARVQARVALAEAVLALEDRRLAQRVLVASIDGVVLDVYPEVGEVVAAGAPIASVVDRAHPYADVFVPVAEVPGVRIGAPMQVVVEGVPGELAATVERVASRAEFTPRFVYSPSERPNLTVRVRLRLVDPDGRLHAGLPAYARPADLRAAIAPVGAGR